MAGLIHQAENLRAEALKFASGLNRSPAAAADQQVIWNGSIDDYTQFLNQVHHRFLNGPDGAGDTHAKVMFLVKSYLDGRRPRSRLHANVCALFIGHADLFNRFERLRFMNDGRQETLHQITEWRNSARNDFVTALGGVLADFLSAIGRLGRMPVPEALDAGNLDFIARMCFPAGVDPNNQFHVHVMVNLVTDPTSVRQLVLPTLEEKQARFQQLIHFLAHYFGLVALGGL